MIKKNKKLFIKKYKNDAARKGAETTTRNHEFQKICNKLSETQRDEFCLMLRNRVKGKGDVTYE